MTSEGARYSCPTAKVMVNLKPENKIETVVASRVLMNMELVEGENANRLRFFILGDSSSSASPPSVNQRSKWRLLVCLKQHASTKIHFRVTDFQRENLTL